MGKTTLRTVSVLATLALLGGAAGVASIASAANEVTTNAATNITSSNATLNATNGATAASGSAFWVSTSTISAAPSTSPSLPSGVYSTGDLGAVGTSSAFSAQLSSASIPAGFTVSPNTTYHYVAWVNIGGTWFPGSDVSFTTGSTATTSLSNITVNNIGSTTATINWTSNNACTGSVAYGTTTGYGSTASTTGSASTTQSVTLSNLSAGTLYHFAVTCGTATSADMTFTTSPTGTTTPLAVTGVDAIRTTGIADNTYADGWEWVMHLTVPDNENAFRIKFTDWFLNNASSTSFPANDNMEVWSAQSSNAGSAGSAIAAGNNFATNSWLMLTGDTSSTTPGRQIDLHIMVKIPTGTAAGNYTTTYTAQSWPGSSTSTAPTP